MKLYAYYLPQYHVIPENDKGWGEGFTEWIKVKGAEPLFKKHNQPQVPLNNNYYNLLDKETVEWQTSLMHKYCVDGLIYYHYYFKGKLLLEKPAENLVEWKDIEQPFFFCWANHPWIKSWEGKREVLMPQEYGEEKDWEDHFKYLLPFFKDSRYEKVDNKPLFCIYKSDFEEKNDMFSYFEKRCVEEGFDGIYLIETFSGEVPYDDFSRILSPLTKRVVFREPAIQTFAWDNNFSSYLVRGKRKALRILRERNIYKKPRVFSGESLIRQKIARSIDRDVEIPCIWFEWDNTPRHKQRGYIITPFKKESFMEYMNSVRKKDFVFINAWNEWAEGMMLEPTKEKRYRYLEWISEWVKNSDKPY